MVVLGDRNKHNIAGSGGMKVKLGITDGNLNVLELVWIKCYIACQHLVTIKYDRGKTISHNGNETDE